MSKNSLRLFVLVGTLSALAHAQGLESVRRVLFTNVHVFDGVNEARIENADVLVEGNLIKAVSKSKIAADGATP